MFDIILIHDLIMTLKTEHLSSNFTLKFHKRNNPDELNFLIFLLFGAPLIFAQNRWAKIKGARKLRELRYFFLDNLAEGEVTH